MGKRNTLWGLFLSTGKYKLRHIERMDCLTDKLMRFITDYCKKSLRGRAVGRVYQRVD